MIDSGMFDFDITGYAAAAALLKDAQRSQWENGNLDPL